ncbi:MAG: hypothetical protein HYU86_11135 [Chloroflexi bacterium]|nr:hypothetical protein [Chloroflexota bacterium]
MATREAERQVVPIPPLNLSGVVINKADLVAALKIYVPNVADVQAFEDGEHFYLVFGPQENREGGAT